MSDFKDLQEAIELFGEDVAKNLTVVKSDELNPPILLRIDNEIPKSFIPRMPRSAANSENQTVPRVVTARTLMGCICGHAYIFDQVITRYAADEYKNNVFKITAFDFEYALKPSVKLVFDAEETGEHWLIAYNKETTQYTPRLHGEFFVNKISIYPRGSENLNQRVAEICIRVTGSEGLMLTPKIWLPKGYHYAKINITNYALGNKVVKANKLTRMTEHNVEVSVMAIKDNVYRSFYQLSVGNKK